MADLSITATLVIPGAGAVLSQGTCGETITAGQTLYIEIDTPTSPPTYKLYDANGADELATLAAVAMTGGVAGQPLTVLTGGPWTVGAAVVAGEFYVGTATPGGIAHIDDVASGWKPSLLGYATTTGIIKWVGINTLIALSA